MDLGDDKASRPERVDKVVTSAKAQRRVESAASAAASESKAKVQRLSPLLKVGHQYVFVALRGCKPRARL